MNGNSILLDTNAVIKILDAKLYDLLVNKSVYVSFITELELLSYPVISQEEIQTIENFLSKTVVVGYQSDLKDKIIFLRQKYRLKLPDAIICATALTYDLTLITNDLKLHKIEEIKVTAL